MIAPSNLVALAFGSRPRDAVRRPLALRAVVAFCFMACLAGFGAVHAQTYDPFLGQWLDQFGNVVPAPNQVRPQPATPAPSFQQNSQPSSSQNAPSLPRLQAAPSSPPPLPGQKGQLALPSDANLATPASFADSDTLVEPSDQASQVADNPAPAQPSEATAAVLDIEEPEPTGLLFTEPLGLLALGEGALVLDPALMEDEPSLDALLSGNDREQRLQELGLGDKIALLSTSEEAERKRNQVLFQRALQERDPPLPRRFARLRAMEKITARMTTIDVPVGQTVTFGTVQITPRACYENPPTEPPESASFLEIIDQPVAREAYLVFNGWMFASSPALSAMDHPIYDVWVLSCLNIE